MLARLRGLLILIVALAAIAIGGLFSLQNKQPVAVDLLLIQLPEQSLSLWLLAALFLGALLGLSAGSTLLMKKRAQMLKLRRERDQLKTEVDRLRRVGISPGD